MSNMKDDVILKILWKIDNLIRASKIVKDLLIAHQYKKYDDIIVISFENGKFSASYKSIDGSDNLKPKLTSVWHGKKIDRERIIEIVKNNLDAYSIPICLSVLNYITDNIAKDYNEIVQRLEQ